ncbi:MAG TPA: OsmC family protein [Thermoanaerobaculia bacterium]
MIPTYGFAFATSRLRSHGLVTADAEPATSGVHVRDMSAMTVEFPGGVVVEAKWKGHSVRTDQPVRDGGTDTALSPFDLFFASIATCMGFYALRFCQERDLPTEGLRLTLEPIREDAAKRVTLVRIALQLPDSFPEKYRAAIERAVDQCAVKKHIVEPPRFELTVS